MFGIEFFVCFTDVMLEINWITLLDGLFLTELAMFHQVRETTWLSLDKAMHEM